MDASHSPVPAADATPGAGDDPDEPASRRGRSFFLDLILRAAGVKRLKIKLNSLGEPADVILPQINAEAGSVAIGYLIYIYIVVNISSGGLPWAWASEIWYWAALFILAFLYLRSRDWYELIV